MESISFITSIFAFVVSVLSLITNIFLTKKQIESEYISKNRMDWIKNVRGLLGNFLELYIDGTQKNELEKIRNKILLYFRENVNSYEKVAEQLDLCINSVYNKDNVNKLIICSQNMLSEVWIRIKRENGMDEKIDKKFEKMFKD